jgi:hypothetical protein
VAAPTLCFSGASAPDGSLACGSEPARFMGGRNPRHASSKEDVLHHFSVRVRLAAVAASLVGASSCGVGSTAPEGCTSSVNYTVGDTVRASLGGPNSCLEVDGTWEDFYNVSLPAQTQLLLTLSSPGLTTYLRVFNLNRTAVVNTAYYRAPDTSSTARAILTAGAYQIVVRDTVPGATGSYRLVAAPDSTPVANCAEAVWLTTGITTTQTLHNTDCTQGAGGSTHYVHVYTIVQLYTQSTTFAESSAAFTPAMSLTSQGTGIQNSTLDSTGTVATILGFATASDAYQLFAGSAAALQTGRYTLTIK